jgi:hypothetical protein
MRPGDFTPEISFRGVLCYIPSLFWQFWMKNDADLPNYSPASLKLRPRACDRRRAQTDSRPNVGPVSVHKSASFVWRKE